MWLATKSRKQLISVFKYYSVFRICARIKIFCVYQRSSASWHHASVSIWMCLFVVVIVVCVCMCAYVCTPPLKSLSRSPSIPNGTAGEQKLGSSVACAILNQLAASEGLSVITAFSLIHPVELQPLLLRLHVFISNDMNKYSLLSPFFTQWLYFSWSFLYNYTCTLCPPQFF